MASLEPDCGYVCEIVVRCRRQMKTKPSMTFGERFSTDLPRIGDDL